PKESTTKSLPSHFPTEYPYHLSVSGSVGTWRPSVHISRSTRCHSKNWINRFGSWMNSTGRGKKRSRGIPCGLHSPTMSFPFAGGTALGPYPGPLASNNFWPSGVIGGTSTPGRLLIPRSPPVRLQTPERSCGSNGRLDFGFALRATSPVWAKPPVESARIATSAKVNVRIEEVRFIPPFLTISVRLLRSRSSSRLPRLCRPWTATRKSSARCRELVPFPNVCGSNHPEPGYKGLSV